VVGDAAIGRMPTMPRVDTSISIDRLDHKFHMPYGLGVDDFGFTVLNKGFNVYPQSNTGAII
jgi:hypothetical protein